MSLLQEHDEKEQKDLTAEDYGKKKREPKKAPKKKSRRKKEVTYSVSGKKRRGKLHGWKKGLAMAFAVIGALAAVIYVPPLVPRSSQSEGYTPITPDVSAIKTYQTYLKDNPDADFDNDGLTNAEEDEHGTDIWDQDTDNDGISDYAEINVTDTSPTQATNELVKRQQRIDADNGDSLSTPYKIDDIIFWPSDWASRTYGSVVRTINGYRFCNYTGWVKFPETVYAYAYSDGIHTLLEHREKEDAWYIDGTYEVRVYDKALEFVDALSLPFAGTIYLEDNSAGQFLAKWLPDKNGVITCRRMAVIDTEPDTDQDTVITLRNPYVSKNDTSRFGKNQNTLEDLSWVYSEIQDGNCVEASLYSGNVGEIFCIIYGYDSRGNLLVANEKLELCGKIYITELTKKMMDKDGEVGYVLWYEWSGLGFSSYRYGDKIRFVGVSSTNESEENISSQTKETDPQEIQPQTTVPQTETQPAQTESQTQTQPAQTESQTQTQPAQSESQTQIQSAQTGSQTQAPQTSTQTETSAPFIMTF